MSEKRSIVLRDGRLWKIDAHGFLLNDAGFEKIQPEFIEAVKGVKDAYLEHLSQFVHSIYLTGSVSRGVAIPGVSDLDAFAILKKGNEINDNLPNFISKLLERYPQITNVQMEIWKWNDLFDPPIELVTEYQVILKLNSVCLFGDDLSRKILPIKPEVALANTEVVQLKDDFRDVLIEITQDSSSSNIQYWCKRIIKNIIRASFYMVIPIARVFTRDLSLCMEHFNRYYPSFSEIRACLQYLENPMTQAQELESFLTNGFGFKLLKETEKWLDTHNPERKPSLWRTP